MKGVPQRRDTKEFREEAVKLVTEEKISLLEAATKPFNCTGVYTQLPADILLYQLRYKANSL